jgi:hypothetical protein
MLGGTMSLHARTRWVAFTMLALAFALSLSIASAAWAAPLEPTMGLTALGAKIDASPLDSLQRHHIDGYFKTVVSGSTITTIPVQVLAITGGENADSALILFEASGPLIARYGGIVAGMSGSPVFVDDGGTDKLVGALSYGNWFTIGGTGLATPIDAMTHIENKYAPLVERLAAPIKTSAGTIDRVIVAPNPAALSAEARDGALVAKPLSMLFVGGVPAGSKVFARFRSEMASHGVDVVAQGSALSPAVGDTSFTTPLVGGASVASLVTRGDLWLGSVGTVTYGTPDTVLAYGHPAQWDGATSLYMTNAWVDGIWPSLDTPYKIARPTAVRGEITQDRGAGILGKLGQMPAETPITARVMNADTGESTSTAVYMPSMLLDTQSNYSDAVAMAVYPAAARLLDVYDTPGSAVTTTTIVVSDGDHTYTVVQPNVVDDSAYLLDTLTYDPWNDVTALEGALDAGVDTLHIVSIDFEARVSQHRNSATIIGVDVPGGIKTGVNHAQVKVLAYGKAATQTVNVDFTLPAGVNTQGLLSAMSSYGSSDYYDYSFDEEYFDYSERTTVKSVVDDLNSLQPNNVINVAFQPLPVRPSSDDEERFILSDTPITEPKAIETSVATTWSVSGEAEAGTPIITLRRSKSIVGYNGSAGLSGTIYGPDAVGKVSVFGTRAGTPGEVFLGYATVKYSNMWDGPLFYFYASGLKANTTLRVHVDASDDGQWTEGNATTSIRVRAKVGLTASDKRFSAGKRIRLTSTVYPASAVGRTVTFQRWNASQKRWRSISSAKLVLKHGKATASISWKPRAGTQKIRAHFEGGTTNLANGSSSLKIYAE